MKELVPGNRRPRGLECEGRRKRKMQEGDAVDWKSWMTEGWMMRKRKKAKVSVFGHSRNCRNDNADAMKNRFSSYTVSLVL